MIETPEQAQVVCAGHSLGAAVASICGLWAAAHYPAADILTVTLGQPFTGDQEYVDVRTFNTLSL